VHVDCKLRIEIKCLAVAATPGILDVSGAVDLSERDGKINLVRTCGGTPVAVQSTHVLRTGGGGSG
jgi:hypothetical protein